MRMIAAALVAITLPAMAMADDAPPPEGAKKLSEVIAALEGRVGDTLSYIDEAEWDDGRWEIEYVTTDGSEVEVNIDALTGEQIAGS